MNIIEKIIETGTLTHFDFFSIEQDKVILPDGRKKIRHFIKHPGGVCIIAQNEKGEIALVQQFRHAVNEVTLEFPAGKIKINDLGNVASSAERELREETGIISESFISLGLIYPSPGILSEKIYLYFATGLTDGITELDDDEFINVFWLTVPEIKEKIVNGLIKDSKTITAFFLADIKGFLKL